MVGEVGLRRRGHARLGLGAEILDDDFLDVAVALVQIAQRQQRLDALGPGLADADQDARGERHRRLAGRGDAVEPPARHFVRRAEMRPAAPAQPLAGALQHDPLRYRDRAQPVELLAGHHTGVEVRQEAGFFQHQLGHFGEIREGGVVAEPGQSLAGGAVAQLGLVAQREQRLPAAGLGAGAGDRHHLFGVEIGRLAAPRRMREGAVMANIAAQLGQRDEHLARIGDEAAMTAVARRRGDRHEGAEIVAFRQSQGFPGGERGAAFGAVENGRNRNRHNATPPNRKRRLC